MSRNNYWSRIHAYDGYAGEPFWKRPEASTYDDPVTDNQCRVPSRPIDTVRDELRKKLEKKE